jgi:hypothetical protein
MSALGFDKHPNPDQVGDGTMMNYLRDHLQQVVTLHTSLFEKLLFESKEVPVELAELFEDAGNTYLNLSELITRRCRHQRDLDIKEQFDARIIPIRRMVKAELAVEPGIARAEHLTEPVKHKLNGPGV